MIRVSCLSQQGHLKKVVEKFRMHKSKPINALNGGHYICINPILKKYKRR